MAKKDMKALLAEAGYHQILDAGTPDRDSNLAGVVRGFVATSKPYFRASELFSDENVPTDIILRGLREHRIMNDEVNNALRLFHASEDVRLVGFDEARVRRDEEGFVIIEEGASQTEHLLQVIDVGGKLIAWRRDTGEVFWGTAQRAPTDINMDDEGEADFSLSAKEFVSEDEDSWLYHLLDSEFSTKQRSRMRWALRAYIRYRRLSSEYVQSVDITNDFDFDPLVKRAMSLTNDLVEPDQEIAVRAAQTEAQNLREEVEQAYREALEDKALLRIEWQNLCVRREELLVEMHTLPSNEHTRAVYDIIQSLDDTAELLLLETGSKHTIDDALLSRALETGDSTWWLREHAEAR